MLGISALSISPRFVPIFQWMSVICAALAVIYSVRQRRQHNEELQVGLTRTVTAVIALWSLGAVVIAVPAVIIWSLALGFVRAVGYGLEIGVLIGGGLGVLTGMVGIMALKSMSEKPPVFSLRWYLALFTFMFVIFFWGTTILKQDAASALLAGLICGVSSGLIAGFTQRLLWNVYHLSEKAMKKTQVTFAVLTVIFQYLALGTFIYPAQSFKIY